MVLGLKMYFISLWMQEIKGKKVNVLVNHQRIWEGKTEIQQIHSQNGLKKKQGLLSPQNGAGTQSHNSSKKDTHKEKNISKMNQNRNFEADVTQ